jgi:cell division protein FtsI (penicillin-binding protein 3)/stage V sporulation protein D (sporulation-specific penicillin-binding protein)
MNPRLFLVILFFTFIYSSLIFNIYNLQVEKGVYYAARAASQYRSAGFLEALRGSIYFTDKNDNLIPGAINKAYPVIFAVPKEIQDPKLVADKLSFLNLEKAKLLDSLSKINDQYELLVRKASNDQVKMIKELNLKGLYIDEEDLRFYPFGGLASSLLGFVGQASENGSLSGKYGLESYYNDKLSGALGHLENEKIIDPIPGSNVNLTIDYNIQARAEEILLGLIEKYKAEQGSFIVQDPKTGKILAMGNYPNFDPNNYSEYKLNNFLNTNIQAIWEPGSVMKVVTMAAGLDAKKFTPTTSFYDSGSLVLDGRTIKNWDLKAHGKITMTEVIEQSINIGAAYAEKLIGKDLFYNYLVKFGFGAKTGVALPGELNGSLANLKSSFREINFATAAFGQGVSVTPLQMISAVSAIANGGLLMKPYLTVGEEPEVVRRVVSEEAARQVTKMMVSAVQKNVIAQISKFDVAGKTGTAQIPDFKNGGYSDQYVHTYIGFAPAYNPKFIILIKLDKPQGATLSGMTVVPAFRELAEFILNYYNTPPDYLE